MVPFIRPDLANKLDDPPDQIYDIEAVQKERHNT